MPTLTIDEMYDLTFRLYVDSVDEGDKTQVNYKDLLDVVRDLSPQLLESHRKRWRDLQFAVAIADCAPTRGYDRFIADFIDSLSVAMTLGKAMSNYAQRAIGNKRFRGCENEVLIVGQRAEAFADECRELLIKAISLWPSRNQEAIAQSQAEFKLGLGIDVRDIIDSLQD